jgi:hypothetical protein
MSLPRNENPEIQIIAEPNVRAGQTHTMSDAVGIGVLAIGAYVLYRAMKAGSVTTGIIEGDFVQEQYPAGPVGPCQQAQVAVTVVNPTATSKTYTVLGDILNAQGQVVAHWWPDGAQGASASTAYHGIPVTVGPFSTATVTGTTSPWSLPGTFGTTWTLQWNGRTLTTRTRATAFQTSFATAPTGCGAPA